MLDYMLARATEPRASAIVLLQHAIDSIAGTFYTQVLFADFELQAHRLVEQDQPITAEIAERRSTRRCSRDYYGDVARRGRPCRASRGRASRTSSARRTTSISTRPASRRPRGSMQEICAATGRDAARRRVERYLDAAARGRQRLSDEAAGARRRRSQPARYRPRGRQRSSTMLVTRLEAELGRS